MLRAGALALAAAFVCAAPADGAYPGRNGRVAYVESALGRIGSGWGPTIVSVRLDGTGRQTLTTATRTSGDFEPAWSPDGRRLAYVHSTGRQLGPGTSGTEIWVMNADGSEQTAAHAERRSGTGARPGAPTGGASCSCAAGSSWGATSSRAPTSGSCEADGRAQRRLTRTPELELDPAWAPRGDRLAFLVAPLTRSCNAAPLHRRPRARALDVRAGRHAQDGRRARRRPHPLRARRGRRTARGWPQGPASA